MDRPNDAKRPAILRAASAPDDAQRARLTAFLRNRYGVEPELTWVEDPVSYTHLTLPTTSRV